MLFHHLLLLGVNEGEMYSNVHSIVPLDSWECIVKEQKPQVM